MSCFDGIRINEGELKNKENIKCEDDLKYKDDLKYTNPNPSNQTKHIKLTKQNKTSLHKPNTPWPWRHNHSTKIKLIS